MKGSKKLLRDTARQPQKFAPETAEAKLMALLERRIVELEKANTKLLRMVEMVVEERYYRPTITGGVRENKIAAPIDSLNDVTVFDEAADEALSSHQQGQFEELEKELHQIEAEHNNWRSRKGLEHEETAAAVV